MYLEDLYKWIQKDLTNNFIEFARRQVKGQDTSNIELTPRQQMMWDYFVWDQMYYNHIDILGEFKPEMARAINAIRNRIEGFRQADQKNSDLLKDIKEKEERMRR